MQGTSFHLICESISQRLSRAVCELRKVVSVKMIMGKSEGARYSGVNEVMHIREQRVYILSARSDGCCFTRCIVSSMEAGCQSRFVPVSPTMIKGLATEHELASMKRADLTGRQTLCNALHEGF